MLHVSLNMHAVLCKFLAPGLSLVPTQNIKKHLPLGLGYSAVADITGFKKIPTVYHTVLEFRIMYRFIRIVE